jgi:putative membrane protein
VLSNQAADLATGLGRVDEDARLHADVSAAVANRAQEVADACPATVDRAYCDRISALATQSRLESDGAGALRLAVGAETARSTVVSRAAQGLATANSGLAEGAAQLATGTSQVSSGADSLSTAAGRLSIGASGVATGTSQVATGAAQTSAGASSLATGLANGAQQVPSYTDDERNALVSVVTTPVDVGSTADNPATVAASLIPVVLGLVLWLGTLMMFLTGTSVPDGPAWSQASPGRRVLARWLPAALVGVLQAAVVIALVAVSGVSISSPVGLVGIAVLGTVAFAATNQALVSMFGGVGRMVSLAFVAVQAAAFGV